MHTYGYREVGQYHLNAGSDICQDYHYEMIINDQVAVAAVADGIGSQQLSQIGSEIASKFAVKYCYDHYGEMPISELVKAAFRWAFLKVKEGSTQLKIPYGQMDCTMCLVVMTPNRVYYGNVGDSGCILLKRSGELIPLTKQQNDENGSTNVLRLDETWEFGDIEGIFVSALLCTDGIYNRIYPMALKDLTKEDDQYPLIDHDFVYALMGVEKQEFNLSDEERLENMKKIIASIPRSLSNPYGVIDDMTVVVMSYDRQFEEYYTEHIDYL
ncbi:MAG: protein phosphatase 2C domain-containing protein [Gudongella sp.]|nr:protein phosphatase 2C domain-containing protein [Gudongella sp.]